MFQVKIRPVNVTILSQRNSEKVNQRTGLVAEFLRGESQGHLGDLGTQFRARNSSEHQ